MKITLIITEGNWLLNLVPELMKFRHEILVNRCEEDCDVIIATERTYSELTDKLHKEYPHIPLIVNNWDWYDYIDKTKGTWPLFIQLMKEAKEVWSGDLDTLNITEKAIGIKSEFLFYIFVHPWEWKGETRDWGYIMKGSRRDPNKRVEWFERAANELGIPYKSYHLHENSRPDYIRAVKNCSFLVSASREEGIAHSPLEASCCKKPILIPDNAGWKDVCGDNATYFKVDDFDDFKKQMKWLWENYKSKEIQKKVENAYKLVNTKFLPQHMAERINERLKKVL